MPSTPSAAPKPAPKRHSNRFNPSVAKSSYAATPSQTSSVWDWDNFYPPSPPGSDFFNQLREEEEEVEESENENNANQHHHLPREESDYDDDVHEGKAGRNLHNGRYSSHTSSSTNSDRGENDEEEREESYSRSEGTGTRSEFGGSSSVELPGRVRPAPSEIGSSFTASRKSFRRERYDLDSASVGWNGRDESSAADDLRLVVHHRDLAEIVASLEEYFIKAASAGDSVSDLLEIGRAQFERSFRQLKKTVYHSNSVLSALSSSWSSKPPLAIKYRFDAAALAESGGEKSHVSTLERLLAWEKKLYEEVKAREGVKIEHEKKLSALQSQEYKGKDDAKLDKTKASINKLQSLIIVTSQAVSTTSSAITTVRDTELAPQLIEICHGTLNMWRSMNHFHDIQNRIVGQVRGLVLRNLSARSTSDPHRVATRELEDAVSSWHSTFNRLIKHQRDYIRSSTPGLSLPSFLSVPMDTKRTTPLPLPSSSLPSAMNGSKPSTASPTLWPRRPSRASSMLSTSSPPSRRRSSGSRGELKHIGRSMRRRPRH
ncbi:hypothetical protein HPP92_020676 [Vanilla planifolia]|uniref:DUF632 domain-containing protein n=1 Tax=Vanilla planifolia TaxID=51239 RepID=A0A835PZK3_VANPL|nr:hypothetical protein HPP92_020676 [Vanilla planifolia]